MNNEDFLLLVVDDNEMNRDMLSRRLERQKYRVEMAVDGQDALDKIKAANPPYDLVLLDINMPHLDGYQVLEAMKADANLQAIPVIMLSAITEIESIVKCIKLGADDYLSKPFNPVLLKSRIHNVLEKKWLQDQVNQAFGQIQGMMGAFGELLQLMFPDGLEGTQFGDTAQIRQFCQGLAQNMPGPQAGA